ncbi:MAG TPA: DNA polymerase/3'-5' exonuclease PolX, partial [Gemmatimonadaceae bacterium]|nr:DNA polymerase/3'-5' exonuclease PolX [Gemmatimonadaceae bacterium]
IAALLELSGGNPFKARAYEGAARALRSIDTDDLAPLLASGAIAELQGVGPATLGVIRELVETGESAYLERLRASIPEGLLELLRLPRLGGAKIHALHEALGIRNLDELEDAARSGRLATVKGFGPKSVQAILTGIEKLRAAGDQMLLPAALAEASRLRASVAGHPDIARAEIAGAVRRNLEVVRGIDVVAACREDTDPDAIVRAMAGAPGVRRVAGRGPGAATITYVDGVCVDLRCVLEGDFAIALWRATGSEAHVARVAELARSRGLTLAEDTLHAAAGGELPIADEADLYLALGLPFIPPELRETGDEVDAAAANALPDLLRGDQLRGVIHCHTRYSDGKASVAEMAAAARERGWSYIGISDHSQAAFYAGGLKRDDVLRQHEEIDQLNETLGASFTVLKGIEADILADGRLDYDAELLDRFDFVIGSIHNRFGMNGAPMTERVLRALDDPHLTVLAHPTGRLLLSRDPYDLDMSAVLAKAAERGVAVELNADPHRLDLDWRVLREAKRLGVTIAIGPDAHSTRGLDNTSLGVLMARKGWLEARDVLNTRDAAAVRRFARKTR